MYEDDGDEILQVILYTWKLRLRSGERSNVAKRRTHDIDESCGQRPHESDCNLYKYD